MKGHDEVIAGLNDLLALELTAMDQYFVHSEMYADWGLHALYDRIAHEFDDEKRHAKALIERILFFEGRPDMVTREPLQIGSDVPEMLRADLNVEYTVGARLKEVMALCEQLRDAAHPAGAARGHGGRSRVVAREAAGPHREDGPGELSAVPDRDAAGIGRLTSAPCAARRAAGADG